MQTWINFWNFFFWLSIFGFIINTDNFFKLMLYSEISWVSIYVYTIIVGTINDDLTILSTSLFVIGLAAVEFSTGILLIIIFKNINKSVNFSINSEEFNNNVKNAKKLFLNKLY